MALDSYSKAGAMAWEDRLIAGHKKLYGRVENKMPRSMGDYQADRQKLFEDSKNELLSLCTTEWQGSYSLAEILGLKTTITLIRVKRLIEEGRLECRKFKGKVYVKLPQGKSGEQPDV